MSTPDEALLWLRWWLAGLRQADASWNVNETQVDAALLDVLRTRSPARFEQLQAPRSAWPAPPDLRLLPLLALQPSHWARVLALVAAVCAGTQSQAASTLQAADLLWCRRLGRALQPGRWLPAQWSEGPPQVQGLRLLQAWAGASAWQRLRLQFTRELVEHAERTPLERLPDRRLAALWQAVGWYALTFTVQGSSHADPSPFAVEPPAGAAWRPAAEAPDPG